MSSSLDVYREQRRREDARYARGELDKLMEKLGDEGAFDRLRSLIDEMRSDGFTDAALFGAQALPLLKQAETFLERAKGKLS